MCHNDKERCSYEVIEYSSRDFEAKVKVGIVNRYRNYFLTVSIRLEIHVKDENKSQ